MTASETFAIGVDVGGTKMAAGLVCLNDGRVLLPQRILTLAARGGAASSRDLHELVRGLRDEARVLGHPPLACGVGLPELVTKDGKLASNPILGWEALGIQESLSKILPCRLEADVRAAALAEARFGAGRGLESFLYVTVGTGISSCLVLKGEPFVGTHGLTGTMASNPMFCNDAADRAYRGVSLEQFSAGPAILARFQAKYPGEASSTSDVIAMSEEGHSGARAVVVSAAELLGYSIGHLVNTLDPAAILLGGGVGLVGGLYWETVQHATRAQIWSEIHRGVPIVRAGCGNDAGLIGAAVRAADDHLG